ncbi:hypothetical protein RR48_08685 [Papilio machaon]|uniref:Neuroparsin-A n=1 Tax=Papilio machaon TaxID=76193 RepID=A0A194RD84_PAPMA|nr:hypothetical protein RR48_08685 [Papilio machaon]
MGLNKSNCILLLVLVSLAIIKENPASSEDVGSQGNNRLMLARCNYTVVGFRSCASCHDVILCTPLDVGIVHPCRGNKSNCNEGTCSDTPSPNCNSTSSQKRLAVHLITAHRPGGRPGGPGGPGRDDGDDGQDRFKQIVRCNYTETPGRSCLGCRTTLVCAQNNIGIARLCKGFLPYCNQGFCSSVPGAACSG